MAHDFQEPAGRDLVPAFDSLDFHTIYTDEGPVVHLISMETGQRVRLPVWGLPHVAALLLGEWQDHEPDDDDDDGDES